MCELGTLHGIRIDGICEMDLAVHQPLGVLLLGRRRFVWGSKKGSEGGERPDFKIPVAVAEETSGATVCRYPGPDGDLILEDIPPVEAHYWEPPLVAPSRLPAKHARARRHSDPARPEQETVTATNVATSSHSTDPL